MDKTVRCPGWHPEIRDILLRKRQKFQSIEKTPIEKINAEFPISLRVVSEARRAMRLHEHGVFARFRYNDLKEVARDLRQTRTLMQIQWWE
jgi:hypothetical protein